MMMSARDFSLFFCYFLLLFLFLVSLVMSVSTLNLNGARDMRKRVSVYDLMRMKHLHVLMVQETHSDGSVEIEWKRDWEGEVVLGHLSRTSGVVALLFSKNFLLESFDFQEVVKGRLMVVKAQFECFRIAFVNVYAPNIGLDRDCFFHKLREVLRQCDPEEFLFLWWRFYLYGK